MSDLNGSNGVATPEVSATPVNRVKRKAKVTGTKSAFQKWFTALGEAEGGKEGAKLNRKTEEGTLSITIKGYPSEFTLEGVCELAEEVGCKVTLKSETGVGKYDANVTKTLTEDAASGFIEFGNE